MLSQFDIDRSPSSLRGLHNILESVILQTNNDLLTSHHTAKRRKQQKKGFARSKNNAISGHFERLATSHLSCMSHNELAVISDFRLARMCIRSYCDLWPFNGYEGKFIRPDLLAVVVVDDAIKLIGLGLCGEAFSVSSSSALAYLHIIANDYE